MLILQRTADPLVPYKGGAIAFGRGRVIDTEDAARRWARLNGTAPEPRTTVLPAPGKDHCGSLRLTYQGGRDGSEVALVRLDGGGHTWPGGGQYLPERIIGRVCPTSAPPRSSGSSSAPIRSRSAVCSRESTHGGSATSDRPG